MAFNRPTPQDIMNRLQAEIDVSLPGADSRLRNTVENILVRVITMASVEMFGYLDWISEQILPDTADQENLDRHASIWKIIRKAATGSSGPVQFSGQDTLVIPAGTIVRRNDDVEYTVDADITIAGGTGIGTITASVAGASANSAASTKVNLTSPIAGIGSEGTIQAPGLSGGTDIESDDDLRRRILARIQEPPHGGAEFDYVAWAKEIAGVTRAWVYPEQLGIGTVVVAFVMDDKPDTIIPTTLEVADVQAHIDAARPVTADVTVIPPTAVPVALEIHLNPNTVIVQAAVQAALKDFFARESEPGGTLYFSRLNEIVSYAVGEYDHVVISPSANIVRAFGEISVLGDITWGGI